MLQKKAQGCLGGAYRKAIRGAVVTVGSDVQLCGSKEIRLPETCIVLYG